MLPCEVPVAAVVVVDRIADGIVGDGLTIVLGQKVTPVVIIISVVYGINRCAEGSGGVGVLLTA